MRVLAVNAGSSSLKLALLASDDSLLWERELPAPRTVVDADEVAQALADLPSAPDVVGHRVVHGGEEFRAPARLDPQVLGALDRLSALAPLHQPKSLRTIEAVNRALPDAPSVACFDTAFHSTLPAGAATYALPRAWRERYGLRRYGFHGLSHAYASRRAGELSGRARRIVTCHLGAGASLAAVLDGRSIDTTMGFTPLEGLAMATRAGSVDPGLLLWLLQNAAVSVDEMADALEHQSGLLGLAGTPDLGELVARDDADAQLALDVYVHRLRAGIGAMAAALGGLDVLVFTGGVGERSARVRELACEPLAHLGVVLSTARNEAVDREGDVTAEDARVRTLVLRAREDLEIARQVRSMRGH